MVVVVRNGSGNEVEVEVEVEEVGVLVRRCPPQRLRVVRPGSLALPRRCVAL